MWSTLQRLSLGIGSILAASAILLLSDTNPRSSSRQPEHRVALFQMASQVIIEDGAAGVIEGLREAGFTENSNLRLSRFNAEGDLGTANAIAQSLVGGKYDLIVTLTTPALQTVANANKAAKVPHVFGMVSDPTLSGVGIGKQPLDHPAHLVGMGTLPPAAESLQLTRQLFPGLKRVGVVWNPGEINSEICTKVGREACRELKLELLEANAENTSAVREAAASLIQRGAEVLWVGGDVTVLGAIDVMVRVANQAKIPVVTCIPGNTTKGALLDVGANYLEVGRLTGRLAGRVLGGEPIAELPVQLVIPPKLVLNKVALQGLREPWSFPPEIVAKADQVLDGSTPPPKSGSVAPKSPAPLPKTWEVRIISYVNAPDAEEAEAGILAGMKDAGLVFGRDFRSRTLNAQGDMPTLNGLVDAALTDHADLLVTISTSTLQTALKRTRDVPIVFTFVANPFAAGAGKTDTEHLPNVTGSYAANDIEGMLPLLKMIKPNAKRLGAMYAPAEVNSVFNHDLFVAAARKAGYDVRSVGISSAGEAPDTTLSVCEQNIDILCLPNSNLAASCFPSIAQAAKRARVPVAGFLSGMASQGATLILARDYFDMGHDSGMLAARVMRGESPGNIPFQPSLKNKLLINVDSAKACNLTVPALLLEKADTIIGK